MAHLKGIVAHLGRNLRPSFGHLRPNFAGIFNQMTPCTRRNAPKALKILSAFNLPRFSIPPELLLGFVTLRHTFFKLVALVEVVLTA